MRRDPPHRPRACVLLLCMALGLFGLNARADDAEADHDKALIAQLREIATDNEPVDDLSARFEQRRISPLLRKPLASEGVIRSVKGLTRWDTDEPYETTMMVRPDRLELYDPEREVLEVYPIEKRFGQLLANPQPELTDWLKQFHVRRAEADALSEYMRKGCGIEDAPDACVLIRLTPRGEALSDVIEELIVVLDPKTGLSRGMTWTSGERERTELVFSAVKTDNGLKGKDLRLSLPDAVRVVYPLGPVPEAEKRSD